MFLLSVLVVLMLVNTVATSLYLYFQALCQVLASGDKWIKSCDVLSRKQILCAPRKNWCKITHHLFDLNFFDSMLYTIVFLPSVLSFLIWVVEVPQKNLFTTCWSVFPRFCLVLRFPSFANLAHAFSLQIFFGNLEK